MKKIYIYLENKIACEVYIVLQIYKDANAVLRRESIEYL